MVQNEYKGKLPGELPKDVPDELRGPYAVNPLDYKNRGIDTSYPPHINDFILRIMLESPEPR